MKKSSTVKLLVLAAMVTACETKTEKKDNGWGNDLYMRSDSTRHYTRTPYLFYYYAFRPYGFYNARTGVYKKSGYTSGGISTKSNPVSARGGFGGSGYRASS